MKSKISILFVSFLFSISTITFAQYPTPTDNGPCDGQHYFLCKSWRGEVKEDLIEAGKGFDGDECEIATTWLPC